MLKVKVPFVGKKENISKVSIERPNWKTVDDVDKNWFAHTLNEKLLDLPIPSSFICDDVPSNNQHSENMLPFKNDSSFWHSIWLSVGKPNSGGVFEVMKHTRNKHHYAVRFPPVWN